MAETTGSNTSKTAEDSRPVKRRRKTDSYGNLDLVSVRLVRENWYTPDFYIHNPADAVKAMQSMMKDMDREMLVVINMATSGQVINASICSIGTVNQALVSPPEVFRTAICSGAPRVIVMHNHPSGDLTPSREDKKITKRLAMAGKILGIHVDDHIIVGRDDSLSFMQNCPEYLDPDPESIGLNDIVGDPEAFYRDSAEEREEVYHAGMKKVDNGEKNLPFQKGKSGYARIADNRKLIVQSLLEMISEGKTFASPQWRSAAMAPRNPLSGYSYHGGNRMILMIQSMAKGYKDPRWMTFRQLSEKGYRVKKGSHATRLEKWTYTRLEKKKDENGRVILDASGNPEMQTVLLPHPVGSTFNVFNAEQVEDFPALTAKQFTDAELEPIADSLISSSECPVHETAQDRSFYVPSRDEIYVPNRAAFRSMEAFIEVVAHEMIHSTGAEKRLHRTFGKMNGGNPDKNYCIEELRAEIGAVFTMNDLHIHVSESEMHGAAGYVEVFSSLLKEDPNVIFQASADAERAEQYLMKNMAKVYDLKEGRPLDNRKEKLAEQKNENMIPDGEIMLGAASKAAPEEVKPAGPRL